MKSSLSTILEANQQAAQMTLIRPVGILEMKLRGSENATVAGWQLADNIVLSVVNAQRYLLCALGLEKKAQCQPDLQDVIREREMEQEKSRHRH
jgi:hypothetical protein